MRRTTTGELRLNEDKQRLQPREPTGSSRRDFLRVAGLAPIPEDVVAEYDDGLPPGGVAVYKPEVTNATIA